MRTGRAAHSLDLFDLKDAQISNSKPPGEAKQGIVISAKTLGQPLYCLGTVEHAANHWTIDIATGKGKTDEAAAEDVNDDHYPEALEQNRFAAKQIQTPQTVLGRGEGGEPGGALAMRETCPVLLQDAAHDILVQLNAEGIGNLLRDFEVAESEIAACHFDHGRNKLLRGGPLAVLGEFAVTSGLVFGRVENRRADV